MPEARECPLCGTTMRLKRTQTITHIPGSTTGPVRNTAEWICPECDYFEDAEENDR